MKIGKRITCLCAGKPKRKLVLADPPFPEIGDTLTNTDGSKWLVVGIEDTKILYVGPKAAEK